MRRYTAQQVVEKNQITQLRAILVLKKANLDYHLARDRGLAPGEALLLWTADWLFRRKPVEPDRQDLILQTYAERIVEAGNRLEEALALGADKLEAVQLIVADHTMAGFSGLSSYLDLRTGDKIDRLKRLPIEVVSCNLTGLYCSHRELLDEVPHAEPS